MCTLSRKTVIGGAGLESEAWWWFYCKFTVAQSDAERV